MFCIESLVAQKYNLRNVFTDNSVGTAKTPCRVNRHFKTQQSFNKGEILKMSNQDFLDALVIDESCGYAIKCGRQDCQESGKYIICLDFDIYIKQTGLDCKECMKALSKYNDICGSEDGMYESSTEGNYNVLLDITDCADLIARCESAPESFHPFQNNGFEIQVTKHQVIPPTSTPCKKTNTAGKRRKFTNNNNNPFKIVAVGDNVYKYLEFCFNTKSATKTIRVVSPTSDNVQLQDPKYIDMVLNGIGNKLLRNQYLRLASVLKSNGYSYELWDKWCVDVYTLPYGDTDDHEGVWEDAPVGADQNMTLLEGLSKIYNPAYYAEFCKNRTAEMKLDKTAVNEICNDIKAKTTKLTLDILDRGIRDTIEACYEKMDRLKFCKNQWYYCRSQTNLWECVKNPNLYMVKIVQDEINTAIALVSTKLCNAEGKARDELECERANFMKHYPAISGTSFQSNAIKFLCDLLLDNKFSDKLDSNKGFIAFKNGILNLRTGEFKFGLLPEHYITFTLDHDYKKRPFSKDCEVLKQFKKVLNNSDIELDYFMSLVGHAFTGESTDVKHMYFMIDGSADSRGDNGKTFIFNIINRVMGAYVSKPKSSLLEKNNTKTHKQIVGLKGKRFVFMEEYPDKALNVDLLKELADGGAMENEILFGTTETINIMAMFFVLSNHTPSLDANESAGYNRYKEVSFCSHFDRTGEREVENEDELEYIADVTLGNTLVEKHSEDVIWAILEYAMRYYKTGIPRTPMRFVRAEAKTKKANDEFLEWFEEFIEGNEEDFIAEKKIAEMSKLDVKKVRKGMLRLGYKYDKDLMGIGRDTSTGKYYKGGYALEK